MTGPGWLLSFKEGRRTSNLPRFSAFNPNGRKKNANLPKALLAVVVVVVRGGASEWKF